MKPDVEDSIVANETFHTSAKMASELQLTTFSVDYESNPCSFFSAPNQSDPEGPYAFVCDTRSLSTKIVRIVTVPGISKNHITTDRVTPPRSKPIWNERRNVGNL